MRLEPLYRIRFAYPESWAVGLDAGWQQLFFIAEGRCEGSVTGRFRGANFAESSDSRVSSRSVGPSTISISSSSRSGATLPRKQRPHKRHLSRELKPSTSNATTSTSRRPSLYWRIWSVWSCECLITSGG
jgi:hypothetical protein